MREGLSRINEDPPEIHIQFFKTGHWLLGMGHDSATSVQSAIGDAIFQITGKRFRDLPYSKHDPTSDTDSPCLNFLHFNRFQ